MSRKKIRPVSITAYIVSIITVLLVVFPLYLTVAVAFKSPAESAKNFFAPPGRLYLDNFSKVMSNKFFFNYFANSFTITVISLAVIAIFVPMVAWAIARNPKKKYYSFLYYFFVCGEFIPFQVLMIPLYLFISQIHMLNRQGLIVIYFTYALCEGVFLFNAYYKSIPLELEEAAEIDGCGLVGTFFRIVYPLVKPMTATIIILNALWIWNDFLLPLIILNRETSQWTMPLFQYNFKTRYTSDYSLAFAAFMFSMGPMLIFYAFLQKYIIQGLTAGAVKS